MKTVTFDETKWKLVPIVATNEMIYKLACAIDESSCEIEHASNTPSSYKSPETVRIAFDVHVDEKLIYKYDAIANEVSKPVEVSNVISEEE